MKTQYILQLEGYIMHAFVGFRRFGSSHFLTATNSLTQAPENCSYAIVGRDALRRGGSLSESRLHHMA
jgi:hypothetical protein